MSLLFTWAFMVHLLISRSLAQNTTRSTCSDLNVLLHYNASTTRQMSALSVSGSRNTVDFGSSYAERRFFVDNDTSRTWTLSLRVHRTKPYRSLVDNDRSYQQTLILDTSDSNVTQLGVCHHIAGPEGVGLGYQWTKKVLERSLKDNGDCRTMLGDKCASALIEHYRKDAAGNSLLRGSCQKANNTMPRECAGMVEPTTRTMNLTQDLSSFIYDYPTNYTTRFDPSTNCDGLNVSSNHAWVPVPGSASVKAVSYDASIRFPLVDAITFWPNRSNGFQSYSTIWINDVQVRLVCLRPDQVVQGSEVPPSGEELLNRQSARFRNITGEDVLSAADKVIMRHGALAWVSTVVLGMTLIL